MLIGTPSGIGDFSWIWSKLVNAGEDFQVDLADGWPHRTRPFLELLPRITESRYAEFQYNDVLSFATVQGLNKPGLTWEEIRAKGFGRTLIECNRHLEQGKRLEDWLPDLETDFHYEIKGPTDRELAHVDSIFEDKGLLWEDLPRPFIGISAASYRGSEAWSTWDEDEWIGFLRGLQSDLGGTIILLGGFWDDLTHVISKEGYLDCVGKTKVSHLLEIQKRLDYFIGFSSGMGILRTVLRLPTFMMFPDHLSGLATAWTPPEMLENTYGWSHWLRPDRVRVLIDQWLDRCLRGNREYSQSNSFSAAY